jgi:inner membrane protein
MLVADATVDALTPRGHAPDPVFRRRARWASALANNLPDLDVLYSYLAGGRIGNLLHHRGHTHTLGIGMLMGLASFFVLERPWRRTPLLRNERLTLLALSLVGPWIHIAMDFSNSYGVHPFWPVYSGWLYGDAIFIFEPLYFAAMIPSLAFASSSVAGKLVLAGMLLVTVALGWITSFAGVGTALALTVAAAGSAAATYFTSPGARSSLAVGFSLLVALAFFTASHRARAQVVEAVAQDHVAGIELLDASLTPAPANPFCWSAVAVGRQGDNYELLVATVSAAPNLVSTTRCALKPRGHSLHVRPPSLASTPSVRWDAEWSRPLGELRELWRNDCVAQAYLRWARVPFWVFESRTELLLGDLRYDRGSGRNFAEIEGTIPPTQCPRFVPPWLPPRHELLPSN